MLSLLATVAGWGGYAPIAAAPGFSAPATSGIPVPVLSYHPTAHDSILVFGAHPDDETLGAGGMVHAATAVGARVRVVTFTNGDGYVEGVDVGFRTLFSTPRQFIEYGKRRQREALAAAAHLGLPPARVTFLGYPDRGLPVLWGSAWDCGRPYTSPYTRRNRSPYPLGYRAEAGYCGENVLGDVENLLRQERPSIIVMHTPADTHRDHWAAAAFVVTAIQRYSFEDPAWAKRVHVWTYLVHHAMWPAPEAYAPDLFLNPPRDLVGTETAWAQFPLGPGDENAKRAAIREYSSQVELLRTYMLSFVRRNELFAPPPEVWPLRLHGDGLSLSVPEGWDRVPAAIRGPAGGSFLHAAEGSVKLESVAFAEDAAHLYVVLRLRHRAIREAQYRLEFRLFYRDGHLGRLPLLFQVPQSLTARHTLPADLALPVGAGARSVGPGIYVVLPLAPLGDPVSALFQAATVGPLKALVDRSPWTLVHLDQAGHPAGNSPVLPPVWLRSEDLTGIRGH
ncbi:MAG TPA: PIG-L family deacetylase [bacterium]|nr:PIG-L family deacetylase [bacterium]